MILKKCLLMELERKKRFSERQYFFFFFGGGGGGRASFGCMGRSTANQHFLRSVQKRWRLHRFKLIQERAAEVAASTTSVLIWMLIFIPFISFENFNILKTRKWNPVDTFQLFPFSHSFFLFLPLPQTTTSMLWRNVKSWGSLKNWRSVTILSCLFVSTSK